MNSLIKKIVLVALVVVFYNCNQGASLQTYYVDNQEQPDFFSVDIPTSFLNIDETTLSQEQKEAYNSVDKLNMLAFKRTADNGDTYKSELSKIKTILKNIKYQELVRVGNTTDGKLSIKYVGDDNQIDELIIFGNANDKGFAVIRVLGDDMQLNKMTKLGSIIQNADINDSKIKEFTKFFE